MNSFVFSLLATFMLLLPGVAISNEKNKIIHLSLSYKDESCMLNFWTELNGKRQRVDYEEKAKSYNEKEYCLINIPVKEFDSYFTFCSLSGVSNISQPSKEAEPDYVVTFAGGSHHPDNVYYFEWKDARNVFPRYACISK